MDHVEETTLPQNETMSEKLETKKESQLINHTPFLQ